MPEPFDASPLLAEIKSGAKPFTLDGEMFMLPPPEAWSDDVIEESQKESPNLVAVGRGLLGDDYDRFVSVGGSSILLQKIFTAMYGATLGESPASSNS